MALSSSDPEYDAVWVDFYNELLPLAMRVLKRYSMSFDEKQDTLSEFVFQHTQDRFRGCETPHDAERWMFVVFDRFASKAMDRIARRSEREIRLLGFGGAEGTKLEPLPPTPPSSIPDGPDEAPLTLIDELLELPDFPLTLSDAKRTLRPIDRRIFEMRQDMELSFREIGKRVRLTESNTRQRYRRARGRIADELLRALSRHRESNANPDPESGQADDE